MGLIHTYTYHKLCAILLIIAIECISGLRKDETTLTPTDFTRARLLPKDNVVSAKGMYSTDKFEGDIANPGLTAKNVARFMRGGYLLPSQGRDRNGMQQNAIRSEHKLWPNGKVPYTISTSYSSRDRAIIARGIQAYHDRTCIEWVPKRSSDSTYIHIFPGGGCYSLVGKTGSLGFGSIFGLNFGGGGRQEMSLGQGCVHEGIVQHEMMHVVGFFHEQSRTDRDQYIDIIWDNMQFGAASQFEKLGLDKIQLLGTSYDYNSIMHYHATAFSKNGQPTIRPKQAGAKIGNREGFSRTDIEKINKLYKCNGRTTSGSGGGSGGGGGGGGNGGGSGGGATGLPPIPTQPTPRPPFPTRPTSRPGGGGGTGGQRCVDNQACVVKGFFNVCASPLRAMCPKSCGLCRPSTPRPPTVINNCKDRWSDVCPLLVPVTGCRSGVGQFCPRSCNTCGGGGGFGNGLGGLFDPMVDQERNTGGSGTCSNIWPLKTCNLSKNTITCNEQVMRKHCAQMCGLCKTEARTTTTTTTTKQSRTSATVPWRRWPGRGG